MSYRNILPSHKKYKFGTIYNSFSWCRQDINCKLIIKTYFYRYKRINVAIFVVETLVPLHGIDMIDTYTYSIMSYFFKHKINPIR